MSPWSTSIASGDGLGSREGDSGVARPLTLPLLRPLWLGEAGAERELLFEFWLLCRKQDMGRWRRRLKACSTNLGSEEGSMRQKEPLPGSSCERGTFTK